MQVQPNRSRSVADVEGAVPLRVAVAASPVTDDGSRPNARADGESHHDVTAGSRDRFSRDMGAISYRVPSAVCALITIMATSTKNPPARRHLQRSDPAHACRRGTRPGQGLPNFTSELKEAHPPHCHVGADAASKSTENCCQKCHHDGHFCRAVQREEPIMLFLFLFLSLIFRM